MPISVICPGCDRGLKAPDTSAGRKIKCPKCGGSVSVPTDDEEPRKKAVAAKTSRRDEDDEEEERRPKKKKRKKKDNTGLYVGLGVGAAALIGIIILVIILLNSQKPTTPPKNEEVVQQEKKKEKAKEVEQKQEEQGVDDDNLPPLSNGQQSERIQSQSRLRTLGVAMQGYHTALNKFPGAAIYHRDDRTKSKPLLSWRVALLPYIGGQDNLHRLFKLDEPWDSEHNKKLLDKIPEVYQPVCRDPPSGTRTYYQVFTGKRGPFGEGRQPRTFPDGASNTFLIVEGDRPVVWTKPDDMEYDFVPKGDFMKEPPGNFKFKNGQPVNKIGGMFAQGFNAVMGDGSVHFILREIPAYKLHALITADGGENITLMDQ